MGLLDREGLRVRGWAPKTITIDGIDHTHIFEEVAEKIAEIFFYGRHTGDGDFFRREDPDMFFDLLKERVLQFNEQYRRKEGE